MLEQIGKGKRAGVYGGMLERIREDGEGVYVYKGKKSGFKGDRRVERNKWM